MDSTYAAAYAGIGDVHEAKRDLEEALRAYQRVSEIGDWQPTGTARVLARMGRKMRRA